LRRNIIPGQGSGKERVLINKKDCSFLAKKINSDKKVKATIEKSKKAIRLVTTLGLIKNLCDKGTRSVGELFINCVAFGFDTDE
jgi:hypothetical protein